MLITQLKEFESSFQLVEGSASKEYSLKTISHVDEPKPYSFVFVKKEKFLNQLMAFEQDFPTTGIVAQNDFYAKLAGEQKAALKQKFMWVATVENVDHGMSRLSKPFYDKQFGELNYFVDGRQMNTAKVDPDAEIAQNVFIGEHCEIAAGVKIYPGAVIMPHVKIGAKTVIYPNVTIYPFCDIGANNRIHSGTVIGTDGFGYNFFEGKHHKVWHLGGVKTESDVEIGCNTMIDAGTFSPTFIGHGSKIDNDVQISHNVKIHQHVIVCGMTGLAGSVEVKDFCAFGAQSGVAPSAVLGQGVQVAARAAVSENANVEPGTIMAGHPARPLKDWLRTQATLNGLNKKK